MRKFQPLFFFFNKKVLVSIVIISFIISVFSSNIIVKADQTSTITTNANINRISTNVGTTVGLGGYDVFTTNDKVLFYSGNGSALAYIFNTTQIGISDSNYIPQIKIAQYNETALLVVKVICLYGVADYSTSSNITVWLLDVQHFTNSSYGGSSNTNFNYHSQGYGGSLPKKNNFVLFETNNIWYIFQSAIFGNGGGYDGHFDSALIKITSIAFTVVQTWQNTVVNYPSPNNGNYWDVNKTQLIGNGVFWIESQTELNTVYLFSQSIAMGGSVRVLKLNVATPTLTFIGDIQQNVLNRDTVNYLTYFYYVDFAYQAINTTVTTSNYYDVVFFHPDNSSIHQLDMEYVRFNDTFLTAWQLNYVDTNSFGNVIRPISVLVSLGIWGNPHVPSLLNSTSGTSMSLLYVGSLAYVYGINLDATQLNTFFPSFFYASVGAYRFRNGANTFNAFSTSNNIGGLLSPYGFGTELMIDYENNQVAGNYQEALNPSTALHIVLLPIPINSQKINILPSTSGSFSLSQNVSYTATCYLRVASNIQTIGTYSVYSNGESIVSVFGGTYIIPIAVNAQINSNDGSIVFNIPFTNTMTTTPTYESYQVNVTIGTYTYTFLLGFSWFFQDVNGLPLPIGYIGETSGGNGSGGSGGGSGGGINSIIPILTSIFGNVKTDIIFIIFGIICSLLTWKFAMTGLIGGIGISTFLCTLAGLLSIWAVGLCIVLDITLIVLGSGLLNKKSEVT